MDTATSMGNGAVPPTVRTLVGTPDPEPDPQPQWWVAYTTGSSAQVKWTLRTD